MVNLGASIPRGTLRSLSESAMPSTLTITRYTYPLNPDGTVATDRYGDPLEPEEHVTQTKCRLKDLSGDEQIIAGRLSATVSGTVVAPHGTPLTADMTVTIDGTPFNIVYVKQKSEALSVHVEALIAKA